MSDSTYAGIPFVPSQQPANPNPPGQQPSPTPVQNAIELHDFFAAIAMHALIVAKVIEVTETDYARNRIPQVAYNAADFMMRERARRMKPK